MFPVTLEGAPNNSYSHRQPQLSTIVLFTNLIPFLLELFSCEPPTFDMKSPKLPIVLIRLSDTTNNYTFVFSRHPSNTLNSDFDRPNRRVPKAARPASPGPDHVLSTCYISFAFYAISRINFQIQIGLTCSRHANLPTC